jgi:hypothetical protein
MTFSSAGKGHFLNTPALYRQKVGSLRLLDKIIRAPSKKLDGAFNLMEGF